MSDNRGSSSPSNAFSIPPGNNLNAAELMDITRLQATTCIVQSWISAYPSRPDKEHVVEMIGLVRGALEGTKKTDG